MGRHRSRAILATPELGPVELKTTQVHPRSGRRGGASLLGGPGAILERSLVGLGIFDHFWKPPKGRTGSGRAREDLPGILPNHYTSTLVADMNDNRSIDK